jgi:hypothetical protein
MVVDYLGLIHVLSNLDLKLLKGFSCVLVVECTKKILKASTLKFT